jgi:drug/metabolite transporter (DMT)-like permease
MTTVSADRSTLAGPAWAAAAMVVFSMNDLLIKYLSGDYPLHQVMSVRAVVALVFLLALVVPLTGGWAQLRTRRPGLHAVRGGFVVMANLCFFLGLAALPLAEAVALSFLSPFLITVFSVVLLGERVGPRRWAAIAVGLVGVVLVLRPGGEAFQPAALLPLAGALFYALMQTVTRRLGGTETASSLAVSIQLSFLVVSLAVGLALGDGRFAGTGHASAEFLLRAWVWPTAGDLGLMAAIGVFSALGGWAISQAYRISEAAYVAPFDYVALPLAVFWGFAVFRDWPDPPAWTGIVLILVSGLVLIWREAAARRAAPPPHRR